MPPHATEPAFTPEHRLPTRSPSPGLADPGVLPEGLIDSTSDLRATVFVGSVNTGVPNTFFCNGCTMADLIVQRSRGPAATVTSWLPSRT